VLLCNRFWSKSTRSGKLFAMTEAATLEQPALLATPIALVKGQVVLDVPKDLYIPPDAMRVFLEAFEGPLDFLLYLIRKQNIDILDIPIAAVTAQYMQYIDLMKELSLELAAEYLVMAAILAEIKSRMLLPQMLDTENVEEDPRAELIRRLQEYERFKQAAEALDQLPRTERDTFVASISRDSIQVERKWPTASLRELAKAFADVLKRAELFESHHIQLETLSIQEKMTHILAALQQRTHFLFSDLFNLEEGRLGVVVTFLATLELLKQGLVEVVQTALFGPIYLKAIGEPS